LLLLGFQVLGLFLAPSTILLKVDLALNLLFVLAAPVVYPLALLAG
jgi:hypothetical protein